MIEITRDGHVHILTMKAGKNLVDPDLVRALHEALDTVEAESAGPCAMVLTGEGKFFSNGLNLEVLMSLEGDAANSFGAEMSRLLERLLVFPVPTVAAVNGHAFAAGCVLALLCDFRLMREDRGWICMSEVDAGVPISPPLMQVLRAKLPPNTARDAVITGKRYVAAEAIAAGFADGMASEQELVAEACKLVAPLAEKERGIFAKLKRTLWRDEAASIRGDAPSSR